MSSGVQSQYHASAIARAILFTDSLLRRRLLSQHLSVILGGWRGLRGLLGDHALVERLDGF